MKFPITAGERLARMQAEGGRLLAIFTELLARGRVEPQRHDEHNDEE